MSFVYIIYVHLYHARELYIQTNITPVHKNYTHTSQTASWLVAFLEHCTSGAIWWNCTS